MKTLNLHFVCSAILLLLGQAVARTLGTAPIEPNITALVQAGWGLVKVWLMIANRCRPAHPAAVTSELDLRAVC